MYSLVAYSPSFTPETWVFEHEKYPTSQKLFRFSRLKFGSWSLLSKFTGLSAAENSCPSINSYRWGDSINRKSTTNISNNQNITNINTSSCNNNNRVITTSGINSMNRNNNATSGSGIQKKMCTVHRKTIVRSSLDSSGSSVDEDDDLYEFDIYEDERRYRPILKRTSKYGPLPILSSPKCRGIWRIFASYIKPHAHGNSPLTPGSGVPSVVCSPADSNKTMRPWTGVSSTVNGCEGPLPASLNNSCPCKGVSSVFSTVIGCEGTLPASLNDHCPGAGVAGDSSTVTGCEGTLPASLNDHCPGAGVAGDSSTVRGCKNPLPGSPKDSREDPSSDYGYSSDEGIIGDIDWDHFQLTQSRKKVKEKVHFSDPPVTHIYRHSYKSYIPKDAALVTLRL